MATQFTSAEWRRIREKLEAAPEWYGLPQREYGSVLIGSFNIRKLGSARSRNSDTWEFLADVCRSFDLLAVQEIMDNLSGLRRLREGCANAQRCSQPRYEIRRRRRRWRDLGRGVSLGGSEAPRRCVRNRTKYSAHGHPHTAGRLGKVQGARTRDRCQT